MGDCGWVYEVRGGGLGVRCWGVVVAVVLCMCVIIRIMCPEFDGDRT